MPHSLNQDRESGSLPQSLTPCSSYIPPFWKLLLSTTKPPPSQLLQIHLPALPKLPQSHPLPTLQSPLLPHLPSPPPPHTIRVLSEIRGFHPLHHEPRTTNREPRTTNHEPRTENREQRTRNREPLPSLLLQRLHPRTQLRQPIDPRQSPLLFPSRQRRIPQIHRPPRRNVLRHPAPPPQRHP